MQEKKSVFRKVNPVLGAIIVVIVSIAYIVCRTVSNHIYNEKWKDYDECGLG